MAQFTFDAIGCSPGQCPAQLPVGHVDTILLQIPATMPAGDYDLPLRQANWTMHGCGDTTYLSPTIRVF